MKTLFTLALVCSFLCGHSQVTTELEYNYMKNGYQKALLMGEDVKAGYFLDNLTNQKINEIQYSLYALVRTKDSTCAGFIVRTQLGDNSEFFCIPAADRKGANSYGWDKWYQDCADMDKRISSALLPLVARQMSYRYTLSHGKK